MKWLVAFFILILFKIVTSENEINTESEKFKVIETKYGSIRGRLDYTIIDRKEYYSFQGIPYAEVPIGELRFKSPQLPTPWIEIKDALKFGNVCTQISNDRRVFGEEDCLYLNVYTPVVTSSEKLPVMIFIHGGGYHYGSGNNYGPDLLLTKDVILVTLNYRLGPYGFLSLGTSEYSGNMGLKDQSMAIKWVKENIEQFGGNSEMITLFGQSAGSVSTELHIISSMSQGLFQKAIMQSGSVFNPWAMHSKNNHRENIIDLGKKKGINIKNVDDMITLINNINPKEFLTETTVFLHNPGSARKICHILWAPVIEDFNAIDPFLVGNPMEILKKKSENDNIDLMLGFNSNEVIRATYAEFVNPELLKSFDKSFEFELPRSDKHYDYESKAYQEIAKEIRQFYMNGQSVDKDSYHQYINMLSDAWIAYGMDRSMKFHSKRSRRNVFYYLFSLDTTLNLFKSSFGRYDVNLPGASHGDELFYLFNFSYEDLQFSGIYLRLMDENSVSLKSLRLMVDMWTNFAKYGSPVVIDEHLKNLSVLEEQMNFINITNDGLVSGIDLYKEKILFWNHLYDKHTNAFTDNFNNMKDEL